MDKNNFSLEFLELSKFCYTTHLRGVPAGPKSYELQAVVVHIGSGSCGHYLTLRKVNECWYQVGMTKKLRTCFKLRVTAFYLKSVQCNDTIVRPIPTGLNHHGAYILLYSRIG